MNERIRVLVYQAANGMLSYDAEGEWRLSEKEVKKFAELIVKECANRIDYWESRQGEHSDDLLKHFGVNQ